MEDIRQRWSISHSFSSSHSLASCLTLPVPIDLEIWLMAEERTQEILHVIQPVFGSDRSRKEIIDYMQNLIKDHYGTEVFSFGSVPLKTYLPDGDIDLVVLSSRENEEGLINGLLNVLAEEEKNINFQVKDVSFISAKVKVIKCTIRNIAVDISFNQLEGLCALCFLEQVDQLIGRDHLLKRSIILIKAWCYYESRILGAHCGLLSTYALEVLVLYILNVYHPTLGGPLAVLYKFLDYYSKFDWDNYCVTINGPVSISSLPNTMAGPLDDNGGNLLLGQGFLQVCMDTYSIPISAVETSGQVFTQKHINIVDPLKLDNNLGTSVNKGNSYRIRAAFTCGERKLRRILMLGGEYMGAELENFFVNTLDRNGKGQRHDLLFPVAAFGTGNSEEFELGGDFNEFFKSILCGQQCHGYKLPELTHDLLRVTPLTSKVQNAGQRDILHHSVSHDQIFIRRNMDDATSRTPNSYPNASQAPAAYFAVDNPGVSRGTWSYISHSSVFPFSEAHVLLETVILGDCSSPLKLGSLEQPGGSRNASEMRKYGSSSSESASEVPEPNFRSVQAENLVPSLTSPSEQPLSPMKLGDSTLSREPVSQPVKDMPFAELFQHKDQEKSPS